MWLSCLVALKIWSLTHSVHFYTHSCVYTIAGIATDKALFSSEKCWYFSYFSMKTYEVGTHKKCLAQALLMSTHNICFHGEIRKILCGYPLLTVAMFRMSDRQYRPWSDAALQLLIWSTLFAQASLFKYLNIPSKSSYCSHGMLILFSWYDLFPVAKNSLPLCEL